MSRKVFISVLGATAYQPCEYKGKNVTVESPFIQVATLKDLEAETWGENAAAYILMTEHAKCCNWEIREGDQLLNADGAERTDFKGNKLHSKYDGLKYALEGLKLPFKPEALLIPLGKDNDEIWEIFQKLYDVVQEGDELYFDITHGLRYMPMLVLTFGNYSKFLKNTTIKSITYGSFETKNDDDTAPIVDLLPLASLQDWSNAAADFIENGYAGRMQELVATSINPILRESKGKDEEASNLGKFIISIEKITDERIMCRGLEVTSNNNVSAARNLAFDIDNSTIAALNPIIDKIKESISNDWKDNCSHNCILAAQWCFDRRLYQQAATFLKEYITSYVCEEVDLSIDNQSDRDVVDAALNIKIKDIPFDNWNGKAKENQEIIEKILSSNSVTPRLIGIFNRIADIRNDYNHAGFRENATNTGRLRNKIKQCLDELKEDKPKVLINLSNHSKKKWGEEQVKMGEDFYGEIVDMKFPEVEPEASEEEIDSLVEEYASKIEQRTVTADVTVHVMGEMTFVYQLVNRLKGMGIRCVASTTVRDAVQEGDTKTSTFHFCKFREY